MRKRLMSSLLIAAMVPAFFFGCAPGADSQHGEAPAETSAAPGEAALSDAAPVSEKPAVPEAAHAEASLVSSGEPPAAATAPTTTNLGFSFWGDQIDIESMPEYVPNSNVLFSIRSLSETEKELYLLFAQLYQYLHSGNFDFVSAYQQSVSSDMFDGDVFAVFDYTAPTGTTISDFMSIADRFFADQAEINYLDIYEISNGIAESVDSHGNSLRAGEERITFGMRVSNMHQFSATVEGLNESIRKHNGYIEDFYRELRGKIPPGSSRYETVQTVYYALIDRVEYDHSQSAIGGTIAGAVNPDVGSVFCNGYARTLFYYLSMFDVPCIVVHGSEYADTSLSVGHVWNYVQMDDGKWYLLDATWDGAGDEISCEYFLIGGRATLATHVPYPQSDLENIALEHDNYPLPDATVYKVDSQLYIGGSFTYPNLNIRYDEYAQLVYIADFSILDSRDIRSVRSSADTLTQLFVDREGHVFTQIPATMRSAYGDTEWNTAGKYITVLLIHHTTGEQISVVYTDPIR